MTREFTEAVIRVSKDGKYAVVLCPVGHLIEAHKLDSGFGGSMFAAEWGARPYRSVPDRFDRLAAKCDGAGHNHIGHNGGPALDDAA